MIYEKNSWEEKNLNKKKVVKPITNAFSYNAQRVVKEANFVTGLEKNSLKDSRTKALAPGKRISKSGKVYYEYRAGHSDLNGKKKI